MGEGRATGKSPEPADKNVCATCTAGFPACGFWGHSCPQFRDLRPHPLLIIPARGKASRSTRNVTPPVTRASSCPTRQPPLQCSPSATELLGNQKKYVGRAMLQTLAVENYRSLRSITVPLGNLNVIQGANGSGKSNLYKALRLLAETATGGVVSSLAREGGLQSTFWAGPEKLSRDMRAGRVPIQGTQRKEVVRLKLGFSANDFGYCITMGLPAPSDSAFALDPRSSVSASGLGRCSSLRGS